KIATTAAIVGTAARIANSAVPAASAGISPSSASCAARSQRAGQVVLVFHQSRQRWTSLLTRRSYTLAAVIDTHCHLDVEAFDADRDAVIVRAAAAGVEGILVPAIRPRTWPRVLALGDAHYPWIRVALGVHPQIVPELEPDERDEEKLVHALTSAT